MLKNAISLSDMIRYAPAKINIGLQILEKRKDGFHNIRSVMYPTGLCDIVEIKALPEGADAFHLSQSGIKIDTDPESNLVTAAWRLLKHETDLPPVAIHLHKQIPVGAGLGGGSSNASVVLLALNHLASQRINPDRLEELAGQLGSDCPFFLHQDPMMMEGRGEILSPAQIDLEGFYLVLLFPGIHISTADAYAGVNPEIPEVSLRQVISLPVKEWPGLVVNDFEQSLGAKFPLIRELKESLYRAGAQYASLSGSGSSLYGIFQKDIRLPGELRDFVIWEGPA
jgi:4-diphosphocytidyl-2-C-methyl-D-erythritol kinase